MHTQSMAKPKTALTQCELVPLNMLSSKTSSTTSCTAADHGMIMIPFMTPVSNFASHGLVGA